MYLLSTGSVMQEPGAQRAKVSLTLIPCKFWFESLTLNFGFKIQPAPLS